MKITSDSSIDFGKLKIAIVHDWIPVIAGGEKVLAEIVRTFPNADVFTLFNFLTDEQLRSLGIRSVTTSHFNKWPFAKKYYRHLLPLLPQAVEDFDLSEYDLVISSSAALAKGVITGADQPHIAYVHSPARYAWDMMHAYLKQSNLTRGPKAYLAKYFLSKFRIWDCRTANGVDHFIANSKFISRRITKVYRRESEVIYPPVEIDRFTPCTEKKDYYLTASRMVPYKRIDLIVKAFTFLPQKRLVVIGDGPEMKKIAAIAEGHPNIELVGYQDNEVLLKYMQEAKAFVFAAEEDFGIVPVEVQACGTPVIAYGAGGALETVIGYENNSLHATGIFFEEQTAQIIVDAIERFEKIAKEISPENCRKNAERFSPEIFRRKLLTAAEKTYETMKRARLS